MLKVESGPMPNVMAALPGGSAFHVEGAACEKPRPLTSYAAMAVSSWSTKLKVIKGQSVVGWLALIDCSVHQILPDG